MVFRWIIFPSIILLQVLFDLIASYQKTLGLYTILPLNSQILQKTISYTPGDWFMVVTWTDIGFTCLFFEVAKIRFSVICDPPKIFF